MCCRGARHVGKAMPRRLACTSTWHPQGRQPSKLVPSVQPRGKARRCLIEPVLERTPCAVLLSSSGAIVQPSIGFRMHSEIKAVDGPRRAPIPAMAACLPLLHSAVEVRVAQQRAISPSTLRHRHDGAKRTRSATEAHRRICAGCRSPWSARSAAAPDPWTVSCNIWR